MNPSQAQTSTAEIASLNKPYDIVELSWLFVTAVRTDEEWYLKGANSLQTIRVTATR